MNSYKQKLALMILLLETQRARRRARYCKRKNEIKRNGEPPSKRLKRSESSSSSSPSSSEDEDDSSLDSGSTFDIFSSDSNSDSEVSSFADSSNSDNEDARSDSDHSVLQDDISIKEEPLFDSDIDTTTEVQQNTSKKKKATEEPPIMNGNLEIKAEVLDGIVDAVEVDRNVLLTNNEVQIKEEPSDATETKDDVVEIKEEPETNDIVGSSSDIPENSTKL